MKAKKTFLVSTNGQYSKNGKPAKKSEKKSKKKAGKYISIDELVKLKSQKDLIKLFKAKGSEREVRVQKILRTITYEQELQRLQVELVKMQRWVQEQGKRVAILFEGRDAAGKGGAIRRFTEHLNPRAMRVVALPKPTEMEQGQWYFQRYVNQLPNKGEIVFFDRSWYNRAVVEPVNKFCTKEQYQRFLRQVPEFEHMLYEDGIMLIKFWFSISKEEQKRRFAARRQNPLKQWKISPVDQRAQKLWDKYTRYKEEMFSKTHTSFSPWIIVKANDKKTARLESIKYVLKTVGYREGAAFEFFPDPEVVYRFHRGSEQID
ncbi:MAG TPA: polyphosphate kinase 2 [Phaeodactylibacter sp.]|nr:polyphosphate kinase 2 [Phaeodactylibacter sp.]